MHGKTSLCKGDRVESLAFLRQRTAARQMVFTAPKQPLQESWIATGFNSAIITVWLAGFLGRLGRKNRLKKTPVLGGFMVDFTGGTP
jgi:hypothetical protein